jgi:tRNA(Ile)-lysidine synthetase, N-terminal domain
VSPAGEQPKDELTWLFARAMAALGPFEEAPHLAVAVSGGADSLALSLLAQAWTVERGGQLTALTVDHRLRPESADETVEVGRRLAGFGIAHCVLVWNEPKPATGLQAAARTARYRLLCRACRERGILHLLVAHHAGDQAETMLLRAIDGSGVHGLAAMQPVVTTPDCRILRPLLSLQPDRLRAFLTAADQGWIEDPSNRSATFARVRVRRALPSLAAVGVDAAVLAEVRQRMQDARAATEAAVAAWLASAVAVHDAGYAELDRAVLKSAPRFVAAQGLAWLITALGGRRWEPAGPAVDRALARLVDGTTGCSVSLGRCLLLVRGTYVLVYRECRNLPVPHRITAPCTVRWDGRFRIAVEVSRAPANQPIWVSPAGPQVSLIGGLAQADVAGAAGIPKEVWSTLPALSDADGLAQVPHLGYIRASHVLDARIASVTFLAQRSLSDRNCIIV